MNQTVKYIELELSASGFGCVNTNGGYNPNSGKQGSDEGYKNIVFAKKRGTQMYVSSNCIRGHYFADDARGAMLAGKVGFNNNSSESGELVIGKKETAGVSQLFASSFLGLLRGYMFTEKGGESIKRDSPLTVTDFINQIGQPNQAEVMVNHLALTDDGKKDNNSLFFQETWGDTEYKGEAIIHIQKLQFLSLDNALGHRNVKFDENPKKNNLKNEIDGFLETLISNIKKVGKRNGMSDEVCNEINAQYGLFQKQGAIFEYDEEGILLNHHAIHALVLETIERFNAFKIVKSKGFMKIESTSINLEYDYKTKDNDVELDANIIPAYQVFYQARV